MLLVRRCAAAAILAKALCAGPVTRKPISYNRNRKMAPAQWTVSVAVSSF